jgi:hypothetical protein
MTFFYLIWVILGKGGGSSISIVHNVFPPWSHWIPNELLMCFSTSEGVPNSNKEDIDYNYILRVKKNCLEEYSKSWNFFILNQSTRPITNKIKLGQTLQLINSCHNKYLAYIV